MIPAFRIHDEAIDNDVRLMEAMGVKVELNTEVKNVQELFAQGFTHVILATGAWQKGSAGLEYGEEHNVIEFLEAAKKAPDTLNLGRHVVVIGGGNVSMDATRTAIRLGASAVTCVYRRRVTDMTALAEEIEEAQSEGCQILSLQAPDHIETDETGRVTALWTRPQVIGSYGKDGRPRPYDADQPLLRTPCDVVIVAIGQSIDAKPFEQIAPVVRGKIHAESDAFVPNTPHG